MKKINRVLIIAIMLFISLGLKAHQPDLSSTVLVEQGDNEWVLQIRAALTAYEYEITRHYGESSYSSPEEFQELVLAHVQENIAILFDEGDAVVLQNGMVKLGHETSVVFKVKGVPGSFHSLEVKNSSFSAISRNQSSLIVLKEGYAKDRFVLNNGNGHSIELRADDSKFTEVNQIQSGISSYYLILLGIVFMLSILFLIIRKWQSRKPLAVTSLN